MTLVLVIRRRIRIAAALLLLISLALSSSLSLCSIFTTTTTTRTTTTTDFPNIPTLYNNPSLSPCHLMRKSISLSTRNKERQTLQRWSCPSLIISTSTSTSAYITLNKNIPLEQTKKGKRNSSLFSKEKEASSYVRLSCFRNQNQYQNTRNKFNCKAMSSNGNGNGNEREQHDKKLTTLVTSSSFNNINNSNNIFRPPSARDLSIFSSSSMTHTATTSNDNESSSQSSSSKILSVEKEKKVRSSKTKQQRTVQNIKTVKEKSNSIIEAAKKQATESLAMESEIKANSIGKNGGKKKKKTTSSLSRLTGGDAEMETKSDSSYLKATGTDFKNPSINKNKTTTTKNPTLLKQHQNSLGIPTLQFCNVSTSALVNTSSTAQVSAPPSTSFGNHLPGIITPQNNAPAIPVSFPGRKNEEFQKVSLKGTIVSEESKTKLVDFEADHEKFGSRLKEYQNYIMMQNKNDHVRNFLAAPVSSLNGVGGVTTKYLNKLGIESCGDLLFHFPRDILDKSLVKPLSEVQIGDHASLYVMVKEVKEGSSSAPLRIRCMNEQSLSIDLLFYSARKSAYATRFLKNNFPVGSVHWVFGKIDQSKYSNVLHISQPEHALLGRHKLKMCVEPIYRLTEGLNNKKLRELIQLALQELEKLPRVDWLTEEYLMKKEWPAFYDSLIAVHSPTSMQSLSSLDPARARLAFDEFLATQLHLKSGQIIGESSSITYTNNNEFPVHDKVQPIVDRDGLPISSPLLPLTRKAKSMIDYEMKTKRLIDEHPINKSSSFNYALVDASHEASTRKVSIYGEKDKNTLVRQCLANLPFTLTECQLLVLDEIRKDMNYRDRNMLRLLQGDVGSGKTIVALLSLLHAADRGQQGCMLIPTEILANQHFKTFQTFTQGLMVPTELTDHTSADGTKEQVLKHRPLSIEVLTASSHKPSERKRLLEDLSEGKIDIVVGTQALLAEKVSFENLGMVVIDEEQRFGVAQRNSLTHRRKDDGSTDCQFKQQETDVLLMSATPIPRSLLLLGYGDMAVSKLYSHPATASRLKIQTKVYGKNNDAGIDKAIKEIRTRINRNLGEKVFWILPRIGDGNSQDAALSSSSKTLTSVDERYHTLVKIFGEEQVGMVHGNLSPDFKEEALDAFSHGSQTVLVSTSMVEVGVDISNATCCIIEHADRFGLSQLHQLRGRIGRKNNFVENSVDYTCLLIHDDLNKEIEKGTETSLLPTRGIERLSILEKSLDGFEIAEQDLKMRGPGELLGVKQSGNKSFKIASLQEQDHLLLDASEIASSFLREQERLFRSVRSLKAEGHETYDNVFLSEENSFEYSDVLKPGYLDTLISMFPNTELNWFSFQNIYEGSSTLSKEERDQFEKILSMNHLSNNFEKEKVNIDESNELQGNRMTKCTGKNYSSVVSTSTLPPLGEDLRTKTKSERDTSTGVQDGTKVNVKIRQHGSTEEIIYGIEEELNEGKMGPKVLLKEKENFYEQSFSTTIQNSHSIDIETLNHIPVVDEDLESIKKLDEAMRELQLDLRWEGNEINVELDCPNLEKRRKYMLVIIDTETTGLSSNDMITQLAAKIFWDKSDLLEESGSSTSYKNDMEKDSFVRYVKPDCRISKSASDVTGITEAVLDEHNAVQFPFVWKEFVTWLEYQRLKWGNENTQVLFIAHNARFDRSILKRTLLRYKVDQSTFLEDTNVIGIIDTLKLFRSKVFWTKDEQSISKKLGELHKHFLGTEHEGAHDALADCIAIERLLLHERFQGHWRRIAKDCIVTMGPKYTQYKKQRKGTSPIDLSLEQLSKESKGSMDRISRTSNDQSSSSLLLKGKGSKAFSTTTKSTPSINESKDTKGTSTNLSETFLDFDPDGNVSRKGKQDLEEKIKNFSASKSEKHSK